MEADVSFLLNTLQNIKTVEINGVGLIRVRKLGTGEELTLSLKMRRADKITEELIELSKRRLDSSTPEGMKSVKRVNKRVDSLSEELIELKKFQYDAYKACLSDESNGKVVDIIMDTLSEEARAAFLRQVFGAKNQVESQEAIKPDEGSDKDA